jgi:hypothetical protein
MSDADDRLRLTVKSSALAQRFAGSKNLNATN